MHTAHITTISCVLWVLVSVVYTHTTAYNDYKSGKIKTLALPNTFLGNDIGVDPCTKMTSTAFRSLLEKRGVRCTGEWCDSSGNFGSCPSANHCYNAMHIISPNTSISEFPIKYNREILGNYAMAYNRWVSAFGGMKKWDIEKIEKSDVLGSAIFNRAKYLVEWCSTRAPSPINPAPSPKYVPTPSPLKHTALYYEWKAGRFQHDDFFQRNTYIGNAFGIDPCTPMGKDAYISLLKKRSITCDGKWCVDGEWKCNWGNSEDCYNLEHIIDTKNSNPEFGTEYNKNIVANYIFSYGKWNQANGRLKDWESIKNEKIEIYGDIFGSAWRSVKDCSATFPPSPEKDDATAEIIEDTMNVIAILFILGIVGFGMGRLYSATIIEEELEEDISEIVEANEANEVTESTENVIMEGLPTNEVEPS